MADKKKSQASGDAPQDKKKDEKPKGKGTKDEPPEPEEIPKTPSQIAQEEAEYRAMLRRQRFKRKWPEITKVKLKTRPWYPPPPPQKIPRIFIELPEIVTRKWVPPYKRRRQPRPRLQRILPEQMTQPLYEYAKLKKIWHCFSQVGPNKMMLQGSIGCNSKKYSSTACGSQTGCIAVACRVLLEEKTPAQLAKKDVDEVIEAGDHFYKQCMLALKCYKGKPQLKLDLLLRSMFFHDTKYTLSMVETDRGVLVKHPDNVQPEQDLMALMEKRVGSTYMMILTVGDKHFLIWGHPPPPEAGSQVKTVCYIFDPHMLNEIGQPNKLFGAGAFLRYAGITSFVIDFLSNYGSLDESNKTTPKPPITLTNIEVVEKEPLIREPNYELDLKALRIHCQSEWESINTNALIEKKRIEGQYPLCSLSAVSLATSRATSKKKLKEFYQKIPKEPAPQLPIAPERGPPGPTQEQIMQLRGEDFFLYCPRSDGHTYGRDDMLPRPKSEMVLHSLVDIADSNYHSQFQQIDVEKWILRATRHMASFRYQTFKSFTGISCCVSALGMLRRLRARAWNEDILDETLDLGYNFFRGSLLERGGPIRLLVLGELKETFRIRDKEYKQKSRGIAVWGKLLSSNPKVLDLCRGIESFFKESDAGVLQIAGDYEVAIWNEGGRYYVYDPWPADRYGHKVGLREGGKACLLAFGRITRLCEHFMDNVGDMKKKPFSISDVQVREIKEMPEPINNLKPVAPNRWIIRGHFHEGDSRFPEEHRNKQATPTAITAIAMAHIIDPSSWTPNDIDETLIRGDILYQNTLEHLDRMGIKLETPTAEEEGEEEEQGPTGTLAAADVLNRFKVSEYDCIETDVLDSIYSGQLHPDPSSGIMSLKDSLRQLFKEHKFAVLTARGGSTAVWMQDSHLYFFDPHGCDENGNPSDEPRAAACLMRIKGTPEELAEVIEGNLAPGSDDSFNLSPVAVEATKLNAELGAPETNLESKAFEWISKGTAAIMMGPRGENSAIGKAAEKAGIGEEDMAGRAIALPAAAAFVAATAAVPPPHMHRDHMYNILDAGAEYYLNHVKKTGNKEITPEDLTEKFEMGANTFSIELEDPIRLPLRLPDEPKGEGEEEAPEKEEIGEGEEEEKEEPMKQIKDALMKMWMDETKPTSVSLLVGDYHALGVWLVPGGRVVTFDPAPTLTKGMLTAQRIKKGDEIRLQRIKDEMMGEGGGDEPEEDEEEADGEGEEIPEPEPEFVPPESCPALMVFASPVEFIDKLVMQGGLDRKQCLAPYKLYPAKVTNELTFIMKEKKPASAKREEEGAGDEEEEEALIEALEDAAIGKYFTRLGRAIATLRGRVAQNENYFMDQPNRDNQDSANAVMGIVVEHIEPYIHWKPTLVDAILKYGDRLYTMSLNNATLPPHLTPTEIVSEFHVTNFNVRLEIEGNVVTGDIKAGETRGVMNLARGLKSFFENNSYGVICAKDYCVGVWKAADDKSFCLWEPHSVGPNGKSSPGGAAALVLFSTIEELANTFKDNVEGLGRGGPNKFSISSVKVFWEVSKISGPVSPQGTVPDEGYEWKVLTAYVEIGRGRTILRGSRPSDIIQFARDSVMESCCAAIVGVCMSRIRRAALWTRRMLQTVSCTAPRLLHASLAALGYSMRPDEEPLVPLQVVKRFVLGVNYIRYDLDAAYSGKVESVKPPEMSLRSGIEKFFERHTHGILWIPPHCVAVWKEPGAPPFYLLDPHLCGPTGLRADAQDDGAPCVMTFTSAKLMGFTYIQNIPVEERQRREFHLYNISITVQPIKNLNGEDPPLVRAPPGVKLVPATSKVGIDGHNRRADEENRKHPPGSGTCLDAQRANDTMDKERNLKGQRNKSGWLVLRNGTQFLSAQHSMACKKFPIGSRGHQAVTCSIMAVAMSKVEDVCRWCSSTLDQVLESGDQLYQDSYLHFKPKGTKILTMQQVLRKFYTPGNCVCRVLVYSARHKGVVVTDLEQQLREFFSEEKCGVFVAGRGDFAVALFKTPRGYFMFDPADRDRYGRAVAPPCFGRARACLSQYPNIQGLADKLGPNIAPMTKEADENDKEVKVLADKSKDEEKEVRFEEPAYFYIYGIDVTSLRRLNRNEK